MKILPAFAACTTSNVDVTPTAHTANAHSYTHTHTRQIYLSSVVTVQIMQWKKRNNRLKTNNMSYFISAIMLFIEWQCVRVLYVDFAHEPYRTIPSCAPSFYWPCMRHGTWAHACIASMRIILSQVNLFWRDFSRRRLFLPLFYWWRCPVVRIEW